MLANTDYELTERLHEGRSTIIYRARSRRTGDRFIIKMLKSEHPLQENASRLKKEYELMEGLHAEGIVRPVELLPYHNGYALVLEDFGGDSLQQIIAHRPFELAVFLDIAIQLVSIIGTLHRNKIIHKDIKPKNIIVHPETLRAKLTDFGIATRFASELQEPIAPKELEGTLYYMSPEQTGRMNRTIDYRTDFYSLGATFYEMLTGNPPFQAIEPLELIHCHIAKSPIPPYLVNEQVPKVVSDIVMKCLAKNAEDRYQSAYGLQADLERCLREYRIGGTVPEFPVGSFDNKDVFHIPQQLYGRKEAFRRLRAAYDRTGYGERGCVLVSGHAGIGKSSLIQGMVKEVSLDRNLFLSGKFDKLQSHIPYYAVIRAFRGLVRQLASEDEEQVEEWTRKLRGSLKDSLHVLTEVLPELEWLVGRQPAVSLSAADAKNRFHYAVLHFLQCFTEKSCVVLFLDDLQWADAGSLQLLHFLSLKASIPSLLIVGAYREEELASAHSLSWLIGELQRSGAAETIALSPLTAPHVERLIGDTLGCTASHARSLAAKVMEKTGGNPFFVKQFLTELVERKLLRFDYGRGVWIWSEEDIAALKVTDYVIGFMGAKLGRLSEETRRAVQLASSIGDPFDLPTVSALLNAPEDAVLRALDKAMRAQLIAPIGNGRFAFLHDKIKDYCYSSLSVEERTCAHLRLAELLLKEREASGSDDSLFALVHHYSLCLDALASQEERELVAGLMRSAGHKAKTSAAFASASEYFENGIRLLGPTCFEERYELAYGLHLGLLEASFLNGRFEEAIERFGWLKERARTAADRAAAYTVMVNMYTQMGQHETAVRIGTEGLAESFGIRLGNRPGRFDLIKAVVPIRTRMAMKKIDAQKPKVARTQEKTEALLKLMMDTSTPAYFTDSTLYLQIMLRIVSLTLRYGCFPESSNAFNAYGLLLGSSFGQYSKGFEMGRLGLALSERFQHPALRCKSNFTFAVFIHPWNRHARTSVDYLWTSYHAGLEAGDLVYAGYAVTYVILVLDFIGKPLHDLLDEMERLTPFLRQTQNPDTAHMISMLRHFVWNLMGKSDQPLVIGDSPEEEAARHEALKGSLNQVILQVYYMKKMLLYYLLGEYDAAFDMAEKSESVIGASLGLFHAADHACLSALTIAEVLPRHYGAKRRRLLNELYDREQRLKRWGLHAPDNFRHLYLLVKAERCRLLGRGREAERHYEEAVAGAMGHGYIQFAAIAAERAAIFSEKNNRRHAAKSFMTEAYNLYVHWGAKVKSDQLERLYPHLLYAPAIPRVRQATSTATTTLSHNSLDLATVVTASQAISEELVLGRLIEKLMTILMQNTGSTRGVLMMKRKGGLFVEAEADMGEEEALKPVRLLEPVDVRDFGRVPLSIIYRAARTYEHIVIGDAAQEGIFENDAYVARHKPRSVLCAPIMHQGQLNALLYLENRLASHAFTEERRMIVDILAGQAAISIEHAKLVSLLEEKVKERTDEVIRMEESRRKLLSNISHDLRTPLTSIQGYVEAMLDGVVSEPEARDKYLRVIHSRVISIQSLMKDLIQLSKMEMRQLPLKRSAQPVPALVRYLYQKHELDAEKAGIAYELALHESLERRAGRDEGAEPCVMVDAERIGQVFSNLVYNAIRHTPQGGSIRISARLEADGSKVLLQVADTGSGIADEDLPYIFDRFYRGTKSRSSSEGGSGLGLSIAKEIIHLHDGHIWAESFVGQGSTFYFTLPVTRSAEPALAVR